MRQTAFLTLCNSRNCPTDLLRNQLDDSIEGGCAKGVAREVFPFNQYSVGVICINQVISCITKEKVGIFKPLQRTWFHQYSKGNAKFHDADWAYRAAYLVSLYRSPVADEQKDGKS
jgi:hypothetical protein